jgi:glycine/D-amino acid oxidase-like deaminating enzyme
VIVCGGVIGYSVAYHLTKLGGNRRFKLRFQHHR